MKKQILSTVALIAVFAFLLTGCDFGRQKKLEEAYRMDVLDLIDAIGTANETLNTAVEAFFAEINDTTRQGALDGLDGLEKAYTDLRDLTPPESYVSTQDSIRYGVELALQATAIYREEFEKVTDENFDDAFVDNIKEADELVRQAQAKLLEASADVTSSEE